MLTKLLLWNRDTHSNAFPSKGYTSSISDGARGWQRGVAKEMQEIQDREEEHLLGYEVHLREKLCLLVNALIDLGVDSECTVC